MSAVYPSHLDMDYDDEDEKGSCVKCAKYALFAINSICLAGGLSVLGLCIYIVVNDKTMQDLLDTPLYMYSVYVLVGVGCTIILVSFLGCIGANKEVRCMLIVYSVLVFFFFAALLTGGILLFVFRDTVTGKISDQLNISMNKYGDGNELITKAWDDVQKHIMCCGKEKPQDWLENNQPSVPMSCCTDMEESDECTVSKAYQDGCVTKIKEELRHHAVILASAASAVAMILVAGLVFSCILFKSIP